MKKTRFRKAVEENGLRVVDISRRAGALPSTVCRQMREGIKTLRVAKRYAAVLDCSPLELLG